MCQVLETCKERISLQLHQSVQNSKAAQSNPLAPKGFIAPCLLDRCTKSRAIAKMPPRRPDSQLSEQSKRCLP